MSATVTELRPYQAAVQQAQRVGVPRAVAVHEVAEERRAGRTGQAVAWALRMTAMGLCPPTGPEAA